MLFIKIANRFYFFLFIVLVIVIINILIIIYDYQFSTFIHKDTSDNLLNKNFKPQVKKLNYVRMHDGVKEWALTAEDVHYGENNGQLILIKAKITYFSYKNYPITIISDYGEYNLKKQLIILQSNVRGDINNKLSIESEYLEYSEREQILNTNSWIILTGSNFKTISKGLMIVFSKKNFLFKKQIFSTFIQSNKN